MKTIKYILSVAAITLCTTIAAQSLAEEPQMQWQSTGAMAGSGTNLPMAAQQGVSTTYDNENGTRNRPGIRKVGKDDDIGDPGALPVGDGILVLTVLGAAYSLTRRRKE